MHLVVVGGSDDGVSAGLRARELSPSTEVTVARGSDGLAARADPVLVAAGVRPNAELATSAGIERGAHGAIPVDRSMAKTAPNVWAAGDCSLRVGSRCSAHCSWLQPPTTRTHRPVGVRYAWSRSIPRASRTD